LQTDQQESPFQISFNIRRAIKSVHLFWDYYPHVLEYLFGWQETASFSRMSNHGWQETTYKSSFKTEFSLIILRVKRKYFPLIEQWLDN
jgi:hypothetical protein